jgi:hypothetical protein
LDRERPRKARNGITLTLLSLASGVHHHRIHEWTASFHITMHWRPPLLYPSISADATGQPSAAGEDVDGTITEPTRTSHNGKGGYGAAPIGAGRGGNSSAAVAFEVFFSTDLAALAEIPAHLPPERT